MSEEVPEGRRPDRRQRLTRWALWLVAGILVLWAVAWLAVPPIVKSQAEQQLSSLLGREVRIGRIGFSPWSLTLTVEKFVLGAAQGRAAAPQLSVERIVVNADLRSALRLAPVIEALEIDTPVLRVARVAEGRYDFDDIVERFAKAPPPPKDDEPARFALYNMKLQGGSVEFDDRPVQRVHRLQELQLTLPFLSNLLDLVTVDVLPRLAFKLDGAAFDSGAQSKPFSQDRASQIDLRITDLDLAPWLPYLPASLPLRPSRGKLATQLQVQFALGSDGTPRMSLRGNGHLADAAIVAAGAADTPVMSWRILDVAFSDVQPLARKVALGDVALGGLQVDARRDAQGRFNLLPAQPASSASAPPPSAPAAASPAWQFSIARFTLALARIDWRDASTRPAAALRAEPVDVQVGPLRWPFEAPAPMKLNARLAALDAQGGPAGEAATLSIEGQATDRAAEARADLQRLELGWLEPYLSTVLAARLEGRASAQAGAHWAAGEPMQVKLDTVNASVEALKLVDGATAARAPIAVGGIALADGTVDLAARQVSLGALKIDRPALSLSRDAQGRWNFAQWQRAETSGASPAASSKAEAGAPWSLKLGELQVNAAEFRLDDQRPAPTAAQPVRLRGALNASVRELAWPNGPAAKTQLQLRVSQSESANAASARSVGGRLDWNGSIAPAPLAARGTLRIERFPLHAFAPYLEAAAAGLNVDLLRADLDWRGDIALAQRANEQWDASVKGNARIADLRLHERVAAGRGARGGDELLTWQSFAVDGLAFEMRGSGRPRLAIANAALTDFYSRLVITEDGRFNLRDVAAAPPAAAAPTAAAAASAPASATAPTAAASAAATAPAAGLPLDIRVGGVKLANGKVDFTDRFIRPNYSAALTELNGTLGAFDSTAPREMATLDLKGRAAGTALLEISGALNPTAQPLALDIRARATDLELAPLSPYAGRYAGYAIERGKLSMDVAYKIDPDGKLDAKNQVILNQLTFGDKVESPDATKLPVLLAVALLKDRNGVIDINLPISGSINDPQFSVFGIVLKIIGNLLVKALTAPFALLAGGGSEDLSFVGFEAGTTAFTEAGRATLDKVAQALADRPALKMTVTGASDPQSEREAIQQAALNARVTAEQRRDALRAGAAVDAPLPALTPAQRNALVKRIYDDTRLPNKPRNAIGLARDIPVPEMEALLRSATLVSSDSARELALQRGLAVRDALVAKGLPADRLFLAAPKLRASGEDDAAWSPRVQLALSTQ